MALNKNLIISLPSCAELTEDQVNAIIKLSVDDENNVIAAKTKEIHDMYDADIEALTNIDKNVNGEKTYDYLKRSVSQVISTLKEKNADLENKIKSSSSDDVLKQKLADSENKFNQMTAKMTEMEKKQKEVIQAKDMEIKNLAVMNEIDKSLSGIKFKDTIPETVTNTYINVVKKSIIDTYNTEYIDDGKGGKQLIFRDKATGLIKNNAENGLNPYTAAELMRDSIKELIDTTKGKGGVGGNSANEKSMSYVLDTTITKTQDGAETEIRGYLTKNGYAAGTEEYQTEFNKIWTDNKVQELPIK